MLKTRVIPAMLLKERGFVKTRQFKKPVYLGDPKNIVRIFNDKEVDELAIFDITASREGRRPDFDYLKELTVECFMPVCYGGGVRHLEDIEQLFALGIEKVAINTYAIENPRFIQEISTHFGSQSIMISIDVKKDMFGRYTCRTLSGRKNSSISPVQFAQKMQDCGAGEILINAIDCDGIMKGYDIPLIKTVTSVVDIPVIACGGAGNTSHFQQAVTLGGASAVAAGSFFVFQGPHRAVLISYPNYKELETLLNSENSPHVKEAE
jgi:imidazole glycerol-phosphate synthase subunit HisF